MQELAEVKRPDLSQVRRNKILRRVSVSETRSSTERMSGTFYVSKNGTNDSGG